MEYTVEAFNSQLALEYLRTSSFAFDIETDTNDYHWESGDRGLAYPADITHVSFYAPGLPAMVLSASYNEIHYVYDQFDKDSLQFSQAEGDRWLFQFSEEEVQFLRQMFMRDNYTAVAHNLVFDARQLFGKLDLTPPESSSFWDTFAIHIFGAWGDPEEDEDEASEKVRQSYTLYNLTSQWLTEEQRQWWAGMKGERGNLTRLILNQKFKEKQGISDDDVAQYVAIDSVKAYELYQWQKQEIEERGYEAVSDEQHKVQMDSMQTLLQIELDYTKLCIEMSKNGVKANMPYLREELVKYTELWKQNLEVLGLTLETEAQFRKAKWKQQYILSRLTPPEDPLIQKDNQLKTKKGAWSFNKFAIGYYMEEYPDLIYMRYQTDLETKIKQINSFMRHAEYDGRIHFILSRATVTGRNSGMSPNTQNLRMKAKPPFYPEKAPVKQPGTDIGYLIADEGYQLISIDCSNAENWSQALYGMDDTMAMACASEDFHTVMASTVYFPTQWEQWDKEQRKGWRNFGKNITFGRAYGMGVARLARTLKIDFEFAKQIEANTDRKFWKIKMAKDRSSSFAEQNHYTILWTGRRVMVRKGYNKDGDVETKGYTAWNSLAQGGVGEIICRGMLNVRKLLKKYSSRIVTQVHDELVLMIRPSEYHEIIIPIIEELSNIVPDTWNNRTLPACRWLFTFDPRDDASKWGYNPKQKYLLPLDTYVNRWGFHEFGELKEAPVWINEYGYGETALDMELGNIEGLPQIAVKRDGISWGGLRQNITETLETLNTPISINQQTFIFPDNVIVAREFYHRQGDSQYRAILDAMDKLGKVVDSYRKWLN